MLLILLSWIIILAVFLAFGNIVISLWIKVSGRGNTYSTIDTFWLGLASVGSLLILISLFYPINLYTTISVIGIAFIYWIFNWKKGIIQIKTGIKKFAQYSAFTKISLILAFFAILFFCMRSEQVYDYGLYYQQTMMWNEQYSVVPGLGNIHGRFGFNTSALLLSNLFYHPELYKPFFPLNALCVFVFTFWLILRIEEVKNLVHKLIYTFVTLLILFSFVLLLSSAATDIPTNILALYVLFNCVFYRKIIADKGLIFLILPFFCMTLKTSTAPIGLIPLFVLFLFLKRKEYKSTLFLIVTSCIIVIPWLIRFVVITGYLIYPMSSIDLFNFDWKMPLESVQMETIITKAWAQAPSQKLDDVMAYSFSEWFIPWFLRLPLVNKILYMLIGASPLLMLLSVKKIKENGFVFYSWLTAFIGFAICFFSAPTIRFGFAFVIYGGLVPFLLLFSNKLLNFKYSNQVIGVVLILFMAYFVRSGLKQLNINREEHNVSYSSLIYKPLHFDYEKKKKDIYIYDYKIGDIVFYSPNEMGANPITCYETCIDHCYDQLLPCTPYLNENLEMRGESLQNGFRIKKQ
ncbi:MAG: hypothetical protein E6767_10000 [Dysgonomonas sp.]|nr:hypothetical protein [Dysgonomonas sp.]